ncbi:MAG: hypothetical protein GY696_06000 [Gammaproteobacteria bacterium]|nr:hypothetical protein [Gammaproteobacteria bacterium]
MIGSTGNPGILNFTGDVDRVLDENLLGVAGIESAFCRVLSAPRIFQNKESRGRFLIQRVLVYEYEQEVSR